MLRPSRPNRSLKMARPSGMTERLVAAFMLGSALFMPPLLTVFAQGGTVGGVPLLFVYLFCAWLGLIVALALIIERAGPHEATEPPDAGPGEGG